MINSYRDPFRKPIIDNEVLIKIDTLFECIKLRDVDTAVHSLTMAYYSYQLAQIYMPGYAYLYYAGSLIHDVGKIAMGDDILKGNKKLSVEERYLLREHVTAAITILKELEMPETIVNIAKYHHERYDGSGYLFGLRGKQIPLEGRISAVSDTYAALVTNRPYQCALNGKAVLEIMQSDSHLFDAEILESFLGIIEKEPVNSKSDVKKLWKDLISENNICIN